MFELGQKFDKVLVVELNQGQYLEEVQRCMGRRDINKLTKDKMVVHSLPAGLFIGKHGWKGKPYKLWGNLI